MARIRTSNRVGSSGGGGGDDPDKDPTLKDLYKAVLGISNKLDKINGWLMIYNYNLLRNMWKHPNANRFIPDSHRDKFNKKTTDRRMFIFNTWKIFLSTNNWSTIHMAHKSYKTYEKSIDTIIKFLLTKELDCPF